MSEKNNLLREQIKESISNNLLFVEENLQDNISYSPSEFGLEINLNCYLKEYAEKFVTDIMNILEKEGI